MFRQGKVRIPWGDIQSRNKMQHLINEGVRYPEADTTDLVMSTWFGKLTVENHYVPKNFNGYHFKRPGWYGRTAQRGLGAYAYA
jgi:hypothetical protein